MDQVKNPKNMKSKSTNRQTEISCFAQVDKEFYTFVMMLRCDHAYILNVLVLHKAHCWK